MILQFKTKKDANGNRKYLAISTETETYTRNSPRMIMVGIEIKKADYEDLIALCERWEYAETETAF